MYIEWKEGPTRPCDPAAANEFSETSPIGSDSHAEPKRPLLLSWQVAESGMKQL